MIPVNTPLLDGNEKKYLNECIDSGWISSEGPFVTRFEEEFSVFVGRKYGIAVANGTAAIDIAICALGLKAGDEVIMPAFTIISCISQIVRIGAIPVLVDSDLSTWNINTSLIEEKITTRTKAIMIVHTYGLPVDVDRVITIANKYNLKVIEDAAEMHGQTYKGAQCGSFGDISIFSFYPNKHITTGEGGMIMTNDLELAASCRSLRNLCFIPERRFVHFQLGWNYRMTNLQAALGVAQLERLNFFINRKREIGAKYTELLNDTPGITIPLKQTSYSDNIYWVFGILLNDNLGFDAEEIMQRLNLRGIGTRPFFCPMHKQPVFNNLGLFNNQEFPIAERMYKYGFYIPSGIGISNSEIIEVAKILKEELK
jgi:perosamine synthetase